MRNIFMWQQRLLLGSLILWRILLVKGIDPVRVISSLPSCIVAETWMQEAYESEGQILEVLKSAIYLEETYQRQIHSVKEERIKEESVANPMNHLIDIYHFIHRVLDTVNPLISSFYSLCKKRQINRVCESQVKQIVAILKSTRCWLSDKAKQVAADSMLRAISFYNIDLIDLLEGRVFQHAAIHRLHCQDLVKITVTAFGLGQFQICERMTSYFLPNQNDSRQLLRDECAANMMIFYQLHNACRMGTQLTQRKTQEEKEEIIPNIHNDFSHVFSYGPEGKVREIHAGDILEENDFHYSLCRGEIGQSILSCHYTSPGRGWYRIKTELLYLKPYIYRFYDVILPGEMEELKSQAHEQMVASTVHGDGIADREENYRVRLSGTSWLYNIEDEEDNVVIQNLNKRIHLITGLRTDLDHITTEPFQVVNYGMAGFYSFHMDYFPDKESNDRLSTWLFCASQPEMGGATVFPQLKLTVPPVQGSAILWYNILPSGKRDVNSEHGGCPVVVGSKWISNKWFLEDGQWSTRKCPLDEESRSFPLIQ